MLQDIIQPFMQEVAKTATIIGYVAILGAVLGVSWIIIRILATGKV